MIRRLTIIAAALLALLATPVFAQPAPKIVCEESIWNLQSPEQIAAQHLTEKTELFSSALGEAHKNDLISRTITLRVTDCPIKGTAIRAIQNHGGMNLGMAMKVAPAYGIYATIALIRNKEDADLVREARKQVCIVMLNIADNPYRPEDTALPESVQHQIQTCEMQLAVNFDDTDYAGWLSKSLGAALPQKQASITNQVNPVDESLKRAADYLDNLPANHPMKGVREKIEEFRRSLEQFPSIRQD